MDLEKVVSDPNVVAAVFVVVVLLLTLIIMQLWKIGYYKGERLGNRGLEIPPDYIKGTDFSQSVIPNQYVGNSTGGMSRGAAGRHAQENTSGTASDGSGRTYIYSTRLDDNLRDYTDAISPEFALTHGLSAQTGGL